MPRYASGKRRTDDGPTQRHVGDEDEAFLRQLYADTRQDELALTGWSEAQATAFLASQFDLQRRHYSAVFGDEGHMIIEVEGRPSGRLWLHHAADHDRLVDIAILCAHRGSGLGTDVIRRLQVGARKRNVPLRLNVLVWNASAQRLYSRLGFVASGAPQGAHLEMEWHPALPS